MNIVIDENMSEFPTFRSDDTYEYNGIRFPANCAILVKNNSLSVKDKAYILSSMEANHIPLEKKNISLGYKVYEKRKSVFTNAFLPNFKHFGTLKCYDEVAKVTQEEFEHTKASLTAKFEEKFNRAPRVIDGIAMAAVVYDLDELDVVNSFTVDKMRSLLGKGLTAGEATILMVGAKEISSTQIYESDASRLAVKCYDKYFRKENISSKNAGDWICEHTNTDQKILKKVAKKANDLDISRTTVVEDIKSQLGKIASFSEVEKIEHAYRGTGFKFKKCKFDLKFSDTVHENYRMEILRAGDTRMVYLGEYTCCCQRLEDAGESAMMHGLLHPKAGFWIMTNTTNGKIVAQAEVWEKDSDSLVFDNIEFANDQEINQYKDAIAKWLEESPYKNVYMGSGYNELINSDSFRNVGEFQPPVTAYEVYVISHEQGSNAPVFDSEAAAQEALDKGQVTYYDYVYSDACDEGKFTVALKENNVLEPFFTEEQPAIQNIVVNPETITQHDEPCIDIFVSQRLHNLSQSELDEYEDYDTDFEDEFAEKMSELLIKLGVDESLMPDLSESNLRYQANSKSFLDTGVEIAKEVLSANNCELDEDEYALSV